MDRLTEKLGALKTVESVRRVQTLLVQLEDETSHLGGSLRDLGLQTTVTTAHGFVEIIAEQIEQHIKRLTVPPAANEPLASAPLPAMRSLGASREASPVVHRSLAKVVHASPSAAASVPGGSSEAFARGTGGALCG